MKRRKFFRNLVTSSGSIVVGFYGANAVERTTSRSRSRYHWVVLYWMPYDNDLVHFGEPIVEMLTQCQSTSEIAVAIQSDYWGDLNMQRRLIMNGRIEKFELSDEDSSSVSVFADYLIWAHDNFAADHWAVIIMGHGGKINEISPDEHGKTYQSRAWMRLDQFAKAISIFNELTQGKVELLFFQNCSKSTLENIYETRNCARYTLASQLNLGAPNYYYQGFLNQLKTSAMNGKNAAIAIMESERADMYHTFTLVENSAVEDIPKKLSPLIQRLIQSPFPDLNLKELASYRYSGERQCDVLNLFSYLTKISQTGEDEFRDFSIFLQESVIKSYKTGGNLYGSHLHSNLRPENMCGLSLFIPENQNSTSRYQALLLSQAVDLISLYQKISF